MTRNKPHKQKAIFTPADREVIKAVKHAVCQLYEISEDDLVNDVTDAIAYLRFYCFWLLANNTDIKDYEIGAAFSKTRSAITYGISQVDSEKAVYRSTVSKLNLIADTANSFPNKKYEWHLQSTNTRS
jgi:chromosomal replication initiation ATPase DnaA